MNEQLKQQAHKEFDERFKCIQSDCDGTGCIPVAKTVVRQISETEFVEDIEWEAEQCQFHAGYLIPIKSFIDSLIDKTVQMERERIVGIIEQEKSNWLNNLPKDISEEYRKMSEKYSLFAETLFDIIISLITNKSDINK